MQRGRRRGGRGTVAPHFWGSWPPTFGAVAPRPYARPVLNSLPPLFSTCSYPSGRVHSDARIQQETEVASYFEMHARCCYIVEVYYHVDEQVTVNIMQA